MITLRDALFVCYSAAKLKTKKSATITSSQTLGGSSGKCVTVDVCFCETLGLATKWFLVEDVGFF